MATWPCVVRLPVGLGTPAVREFQDGVNADLPPQGMTGFVVTPNEVVYRFELDGDGEDKLRVRVGRLSQTEQTPIWCEFDGVSEVIYELS